MEDKVIQMEEKDLTSIDPEILENAKKEEKPVEVKHMAVSSHTSEMKQKPLLSYTEDDDDHEEAMLDDLDEEYPLQSSGDARKDYQLLKDLIAEMEQYEKLLYDQLKDDMYDNYGIKADFIMKLSIIKREAIEEMDHDGMVSLLDNYVDKEKDNHILERTDEAIKTTLLHLKDEQMEFYRATEKTAELKKESDSIMNDYLNYLYSDEVTKIRQERLAHLEEKMDEETNEVHRARMGRMIEAMKESDSLGFILKRMENMGKKEIDYVMDGFFNSTRGQYIIEKYMSKAGKFGYSPDLYKYFFNLEENFLPEEYHVYNNLFLFYYMRFVAHADPYNRTDKLFVQSLTSSISRLVYHKFPSSENERNFLEIIKKFDSFFEDQRDYFFANNTMRPGHPVREEVSMRREMERKQILIDKCRELGIEGYSESMSADDLQRFFNDKLSEIIKEQDKGKSKEDANQISTVTENEDGTTSIEPVMEPVDQPSAEA